MGLFKDKKEIGPNTILRRNCELLFNQIEGEVIMLSIQNNAYYGMDKIGSRIWELLEKPLSFNELVKKLMLEYNVSKEICSSDTLLFLAKLQEKHLISQD